jgi:hypothetical protein
MEALALLTRPYERLSLPERASALLYARDAGKKAAEMAVSWDDLETPGPLLYQRHVVEYARDAHALDAEGAAAWEHRLRGGQGSADARVQAFFFGWHERGLEIMAAVAADAGDDVERRARWFLGGLAP